MAKSKRECTNYEEVEKSIYTVSTWKCSKYMSTTNVTNRNGNSITTYDCIYPELDKNQEPSEHLNDLVNFIPRNELPDIYSASAIRENWPNIYSNAKCTNNQTFDNCSGNKEINSIVLPVTIVKSCNGHRFEICKTNWSNIKYPKSKKDLIQANNQYFNFSQAYLNLYRQINDELTARKKHPLYKDVDAQSFNELAPDKISRNSTYNPNTYNPDKKSIADKVEVENPGKQIEIEDFDTINETLEKMCRDAVDPDVVQQLNLESETHIKPQDSINVVIDNAKKVLKDCICYTDCGGYSVCFCYSNCNHY